MTQLHLGVAAAAHCGFTPRYCLFMGRTVARLAEVDFMTAMYDSGPLRLCIAILLSVAVFLGRTAECLAEVDFMMSNGQLGFASGPLHLVVLLCIAVSFLVPLSLDKELGDLVCFSLSGVITRLLNFTISAKTYN